MAPHDHSGSLVADTRTHPPTSSYSWSLASKRSSSPSPPDWGRGLHALAERVGTAIGSVLDRVGAVSRHGLIALPHLRRGARVAIGSARGRHGSLAMLGVWFITVIAALTLLVYLLTLRTPRWFRIVNPRDAALVDLAQRVENRVITQLYKYRGEVDPETGATGAAWDLTITQDEATAWLACKLPDWLRNLDDRFTWPVGVENVQAAFDPPRLWIAASVDRGSRATVSVGAVPRIESGGLHLRSGRAGVGSLTLPAAWFGGEARGLFSSADREDVAWKMAIGAVPALPDATLQLEDGRLVRVLAITVGPETLTLHCRTEAVRRDEPR